MENIRGFKYLVSIRSKYDSITCEVEERVKLDRKISGTLKPVTRNRNVNSVVKKSSVLRDRETWTLLESQKTRLRAEYVGRL